MLDKEIHEYIGNLQSLELKRTVLIETGRKPMRLEKMPKDLDFSKTIGNTTYTVKSHFNPNASECIFRKVIRMAFDRKD